MPNAPISSILDLVPSFLELYRDHKLSQVFRDLTPIPIEEPSLEWLRLPPREFVDYVRRQPRLPFDSVPIDDRIYRQDPSFLITQAHRIWLTLDTIRSAHALGDEDLLVDLGANPFALDIALREFAGFYGPIIATLHQRIPESWVDLLGAQKIEIAYCNLDPLVKANEPIPAMTDFLPLPSGSVAMVVFSHVIEHLYNAQFVLEEAWRVLRPGGKIIVTTDNAFFLGAFLNFLVGSEFLHEPITGTSAMSFHAWRGHVRFFSEGDLRRLLEAACLRVVDVRFQEVIYTAFLPEFFHSPTVDMPAWRAKLLTEMPSFRNEIIVVGQK